MAPAIKKRVLIMLTKPEMPTLKDLSARTLSNRIVGAVTKDTAVSVYYWHQLKWLQVKRYLQMPEVCMEKLAEITFSSSFGPLSSMKNLSVDWLFLVWWLTGSKSDLLSQLPSDKANEFSQKMVRFLSSPEAAGCESFHFELPPNFSHSDLVATLESNPNLKSLTLTSPVPIELLQVLIHYCSKNLQELVFDVRQDQWPPFTTGLENMLISQVIMRVSNTLTTLCLSGIDFSPSTFNQMMPALRKCSKLRKLSLNPLCLMNMEWNEEERLTLVSHLTVGLLTTPQSKIVLTAVIKVFPNLTELGLQGVIIANTDHLVLLKSLEHCLKQMVCYFDQVSLPQVLKCCTGARKLSLYTGNIAKQQQQQQMDFSLPFLEDFRLKAINVHQRDLNHIIKVSPTLRIISLEVPNIVDFNQDTFMEIVRSAKVLRQLETMKLQTEKSAGMTEQLILSVLSLPKIKMIGCASVDLMKNMEVKKRLMAAVNAKGLRVQVVTPK